MRKCLLALSLLTIATAAPGSPNPRTFSWLSLKADSRLRIGTVLAPRGARRFEVLRLVNRSNRPRTFSILTVDRPGLSSLRWQVAGKVRYERVSGPGYLELWNHFPDGRVFFTRTLATSGPMRSLEGTSNWRDFVLPFDATAAGRPATKLVVNIVLPGKGVVELGPLSLSEL